MKTFMLTIVAAWSIGLAPARAESQPQPFVTRAAQGTQALVALGEGAVTLGSREEIRAFGRLLIEEHRKLKGELDISAAAAGAQLPVTPSPREVHEDTFQGTEETPTFDSEFVLTVTSSLDHLLATYREQSESGTNALLKSTATRALPVLLRQLEAAHALRTQLDDAAS